jgi:hypothetical protein
MPGERRDIPSCENGRKMSFLDNLENNLKAMESAQQEGIGDRARKDADKARAKSAAPWAEKLKNSPWTQNLMKQAVRAGFQRRVKMNLIWLGSVLRLEALEERLELRPIASGIEAVLLHGNEEVKRQKVNLDGEPEKVLDILMKAVDARRREEDEKARQRAAELAQYEEEAEEGAA